MSSYLHSLRPGDTVEIRGPKVEYDDLPDRVTDVLFLAGGTGIAPALQLCDWLLMLRGGRGSEHGGEGEGERGLERERGKMRVRILWACRSREDHGGREWKDEKFAAEKQKDDNEKKKKAKWSSFFWKRQQASSSSSSSSPPPAPETSTEDTTAHPHEREQGRAQKKGPIVQHLEALQSLYPDRIKVEYFIDSESTFITRDDLVRCTVESQNPMSDSDSDHQQDLVDSAVVPGRRKKKKNKKKIILVAGPDGFVSALAGPKSWEAGGKEEGQGRLGGLLARVLDDDDDGKKGRGMGWDVWKL